jgi:hypothetical protein
LVTAVPFLGCSWRITRDLPLGGSQVGDRHLKFHETRDNLGGVSPRSPWVRLPAHGFRTPP